MLKHSNTSKSKNKYSKDYEGKRFVKEDAHIASVSNFSLLENYSTLTPAPFCVSAKLDMERVMGIEPTYSDWQPDALPLCYTRKFCLRFGPRILDKTCVQRRGAKLDT